MVSTTETVFLFPPIRPLKSSAKLDTYVQISTDDQQICVPYLNMSPQISMTHIANWLTALKSELRPKVDPLRRSSKPTSLELKGPYVGGTVMTRKSEQIEQELTDLNDIVCHKSDFNCFKTKKKSQLQIRMERLERNRDRARRQREFDAITYAKKLPRVKLLYFHDDESD